MFITRAKIQYERLYFALSNNYIVESPVGNIVSTTNARINFELPADIGQLGPHYYAMVSTVL